MQALEQDKKPFGDSAFFKKKKNRKQKRGGTVNLFLEISSSSDTASSIKVKIYPGRFIPQSFVSHTLPVEIHLNCIARRVSVCIPIDRFLPFYFYKGTHKNVLGLFFQVQLEQFFKKM